MSGPDHDDAADPDGGTLEGRAVRAGDDELDDASLESMRAVWLSMRDEEPPAGGMAALLAAARVKADAMKPPEPAWWQRVLAVLRRPPALAFASVLVLVGGAVLVHQRAQDAHVESATAPAPPALAPATPAPEANTTRSLAEPIEPAAPPAAPRAADAVIAGEGAKDTHRRVEHADAPRERGRAEGASGSTSSAVGRSRPRASRTDASGHDAPAEVATAPKFAAPPPAPTDAPAARAPAPAPYSDSAAGAAATPTAPPPAPASSPAVRAKEEDTGETAVAGAPARPDAAPVAQLAKQAASAAARGDCAAVRVIAARIERQDPAFYRAKIASDATLAKCL